MRNLRDECVDGGLRRQKRGGDRSLFNKEELRAFFQQNDARQVGESRIMRVSTSMQPSARPPCFDQT